MTIRLFNRPLQIQKVVTSQSPQQQVAMLVQPSPTLTSGGQQVATFAQPMVSLVATPTHMGALQVRHGGWRLDKLNFTPLFIFEKYQGFFFHNNFSKRFPNCIQTI